VNDSFVNALKTCLSEQVSHPIYQLIDKSYDTENGKLNLVHKIPNMSKEHLKVAVDRFKSTRDHLGDTNHSENIRRAILSNPRLELSEANINNFFRPEKGDMPHMVGNKEMRDLLSHRQAMQGRDTSHSRNYEYTDQDKSMIEHTKRRNDIRHEDYMEQARNKMVTNVKSDEKVFDLYMN